MNKTIGITLLIIVLAAVGFVVWHYAQKPAPATPTQTQNTVTFNCDAGKSITATFYPSNDTHVDLKLSDGRTMSLAHAVAASGARYANQDESIVFWNKGNTAFMTEGQNTTFANCAIPGTATTPQAQSVSDGTITFTYDANFGLATNSDQILVKSYIPACDQNFNYCLYYNAETYKGTNFESAGLRIQKRTDLKTESACLNTPPDGFDPSFKPDKNSSTTDYSMSEFSNVGQGAAGHYSSGSLYRLFIKGKNTCYDLETRIGQTQFANYPAGTIKQFTDQDQQQVNTQLLDILEGIMLPGNKSIQLPK